MADGELEGRGILKWNQSSISHGLARCRDAAPSPTAAGAGGVGVGVGVGLVGPAPAAGHGGEAGPSGPAVLWPVQHFRPKPTKARLSRAAREMVFLYKGPGWYIQNFAKWPLYRDDINVAWHLACEIRQRICSDRLICSCVRQCMGTHPSYI